MLEKVNKGISTLVEGGQTKATNVAKQTRDVMYNLLTMLLTVVLIVLVAVFLYGTFYYAYMPIEVHEEDVNLLFHPCKDEIGRVCSYPNASLRLDVNRKHRLMTGQPYSISVLLEVPESHVNQELGMFRSCLKIFHSGENVLAESCRSRILEYRSSLLRILETFIFSPFLLLGTTTQRQWIRINFFRDYIDNADFPAKELSFEIHSEYLQVYSTKMQITAELTGLRHIMYHHPWISTFSAVLSNIILLTTIILVSWTRFFTPDDRRLIEVEERRRKDSLQKKNKENDEETTKIENEDFDKIENVGR